MELEELIELEVNADNIYNAICGLHREFNEKLKDMDTPGYYYSYEIVNKITLLGFKMSMLDPVDKKKLAHKIENHINEIDPLKDKSILTSFYEGANLVLGDKQKKRVKKI